MKEITFKRAFWLVQFAYFTKDDEDIPFRVNFCTFLRRLALLAIPHLLLMFVIYLIIGVSFVIGFLFSFRPTVLAGDSPRREIDFVPYKRWPRIGGKRVYPIVVLLIFWMVLLSWSIGTTIGNMTEFNFLFFIDWISVLLLMVFKWFGVFATLAFDLFLLWLIQKGLRETETWWLVREYAKAKKEKLCPMIKIIP